MLPALVDFLRQKRVGNGRSGAADQIQNAAAHLRDHHIRRGESTDPDHRAFGQLFDEIDDGLVAALGGESGRRAVGRAGIHFDVPEIGDLRQQGHDLMRLRGGMFARLAAQFFHADPQRHGALVADGVAGHLQHLTHQTNPIFDRTAVGVGAAVVFGQQEFIGQVAHAGIHIDDVEPRLHGAARAGCLPAQQIPNVRGIHGPRAQISHEPQVSRQPRHAGRRQRRDPAGAVQRAGAAVPQLHPGESPMPMDGVGHQGMRSNVLVVPQDGEGQRRIIRAGMDRHRARAHHAPAAFGLGFAERGTHLRQCIGHAAGVRHLIEAVRRGHGPDPHRLEQNIEARIARHGGSLAYCGGRSVRRVVDRSYSSNPRRRL